MGLRRALSRRLRGCAVHAPQRPGGKHRASATQILAAKREYAPGADLGGRVVPSCSMLRVAQLLVLALLPALGTASPAAALTAKTALRAVGEFSQLRVTLEHSQRRELHRQNALDYHEVASDSPLASRALPAVTRASSRALGRALESAGHVRPPGSVAHHIVAGGAKKAGEAQAALEKFGIGINDAANGAFLPSGVHVRIHTNAYYETVNSALRQATTRQEALQALDAIRGSLF
jgi:hypothetical protein